MLLKVTKLGASVEFPGASLILLEDVSFSLDAGEILVIIGESGSGKTTLAKALTKLFPRNTRVLIEGKVEFEGSDLLTLDEQMLVSLRVKAIRYIFQEPASAFNPTLRIKGQFRLLPFEGQGESEDQPRRVQLDKFRDSLAMLGIKAPAEVIRSYPHQLSVGMLQRIFIAMAIAPHPKLLIADEPTSAVDVHLQYQILDLLHHYSKTQRMAMILVTHDLRLAHRYADKIAVLYAGRIVEYASKDQFFERALHPYSEMLLASTPSPNRTLDQIPVPTGNVPSITQLPDGCKFHPRCYKAVEMCSVDEPELLPTNERRLVRCPFWK